MSKEGLLTLEQIIQRYPPQPEVFSSGVSAHVSRNEDGKIVYVVPGKRQVSKATEATLQKSKETDGSR